MVLSSHLFNLTHDFHFPGLKECGLDEKDIGLVCKKTEIKNNPVKLAVEDLIEIIYKRF